MTVVAAPYNAGPSLFCWPYIPLGYAQYTSLGSVISLSAAPSSGVALPAGSIAALIQVSGAGIRYRDDGTAPTAALGMPIGPGASPLLYVGTLSAIQFIQTAAGAVLDILYYK
jgi:hypothetical protein